MKYFVVNSDEVLDSYYETCEPSIYTARGSCCGQFTMFIFTDENVPSELSNPMTKEEFEAWAITSGSFAL